MNAKIIMLLALPLLAASCDKLPGAKKEEAPREPEAVKVETVEITPEGGKLPARHYIGQTEENYSTTLSFATGGYVDEVYVAAGEVVQKDQLLASLDKTNARSLHNTASASLKQAKDGYRRLKKVYDQGSLAEVKWVEMKTKLEQAKATEASTRKMLEDCDMKAPFTGVIGSKNAEKGMNLLPSQPALSLMDISVIKVRIPIPETEIAEIKLGQGADIEIAALGDSSFRATVIEKGVEADRLSHSYPIYVSIPNDSMLIMPGMVCKVYLDNLSSSAGYAIPAQAVQTGREGSYVWIDDAGTARRRNVSVGQFNANGVWINSGLDEGDRVITAGFLKLSEGCKVVSISE